MYIQALHTSTNILHVCIHKFFSTILQHKIHVLVNSEQTKILCHLKDVHVMTVLADVDILHSSVRGG